MRENHEAGNCSRISGACLSGTLPMSRKSTISFKLGPLCALLTLLATPTIFAQSCPTDNANTVQNNTLASCNAALDHYTVNGSNMAGVNVSGSGRTINVNSGAPFKVDSANGDYSNSRAIMASAGGRVNVNVPAVLATTSGTPLTGTHYNHAAYATSGGHIYFAQGLTASTTSGNSSTVFSESAASVIGITGDVNVTTSGNSTPISVSGLFASLGGMITQTGGFIASTNDATGDFNYNILADGAISGSYTPTKVSIGGAGLLKQTKGAPSGSSNTAIRAIRGGVVDIGAEGNLTIDTKGLGARGFYVSGPNYSDRSAVPEINQAVGQTTSITTAMADGIQVGKEGDSWGDGAGRGPGIVNALGRIEVAVSTPLLGSLFIDQADAALRIMGGDAGTPSRYNAGGASSSGHLKSRSGPAVVFQDGDGLKADLHDYTLESGGFSSAKPRGLIHAGIRAKNASLTLRGGSTTSATPPSYLIDATDATASLNVAVLDASQVTGMTRANGSTINVTLSDGAAASNAVWTLKARPAVTPSTDTSTLTTLTLNAGGTLNASGDASATSAAANSLGTRYTVAGDLTANGGQIALNAYLDAGNGTADAGGDVLKIDGNTSGSGKLGVSIADASAATDTAGDGILVLEVTGTSAAEFMLAAPVIAAGRQYTLQRGTSSAATQKNWYLVSSPAPTAVPAGSALTWLLTGAGVALLAATRRRFGWRANR